MEARLPPGLPRRYNYSRYELKRSRDEDGNLIFLGVNLGEHWETDLQVAITDSTRREDASFSIRMGKAGTAEPYQQTIPMDFARSYKNLLDKCLTLEIPTGQTWTAALRDYQKMVRLGRGWRRFSVENHLREGYQLLFTLVGKFRFLVQFFDQMGKRCTSYPPLPGSLPVAETQHEQPGSQSSFQQGVDGGQASHHHGSEGHTSPAVPLIETTPKSETPLDFELLRQSSLPHEHMRELEEHTFDAGNGPEDMDIEDEGDQELDEAQNCIFQGSDIDEVPNDHPPATMQPLQKTDRKIHTLNELSRGKQPDVHFSGNRAHTPQIQDHNRSPSSDDEFPFQYDSEMQKEPVRVKRPPPVATPVASNYEAGGYSRSSRALRVLQQQGCMRFSRIVLKSERRGVSDQERRVVVDAAKRFVSALKDEKFLVVMRDEQVYHTFQVAIPKKILEATGTARKSKVEVCLLDIELTQYKTHWTKPKFCDTPLLDDDAWAKFAVDHSLEEGDVCVFQLLQSMPSFLFCVHIFRVVEIPVRQLDFD